MRNYVKIKSILVLEETGKIFLKNLNDEKNKEAKKSLVDFLRGEKKNKRENFCLCLLW